VYVNGGGIVHGMRRASEQDDDEVEEMMMVAGISCPTSGGEDCLPVDSNLNRGVSSPRGLLPNVSTRRESCSQRGPNGSNSGISGQGTMVEDELKGQHSRINP
jgi:hypothetical protein